MCHCRLIINRHYTVASVLSSLHGAGHQPSLAPGTGFRAVGRVAAMATQEAWQGLDPLSPSARPPPGTHVASHISHAARGSLVHDVGLSCELGRRRLTNTGNTGFVTDADGVPRACSQENLVRVPSTGLGDKIKWQSLAACVWVCWSSPPPPA